MTLTYDLIHSAFLSKITEFELLQLAEEDRTGMLDDYLKRAAVAFHKNCKYDLTQFDDTLRAFSADVADGDIDELIEILSDGMLIQWLKPYTYKQELLESVLNTKDFSTYSPAELLTRVGNAYATARKNYTQEIREYSYNHGDLTVLHI